MQAQFNKFRKLPRKLYTCHNSQPRNSAMGWKMVLQVDYCRRVRKLTGQHCRDICWQKTPGIKNGACALHLTLLNMEHGTSAVE